MSKVLFYVLHVYTGGEFGSTFFNDNLEELFKIREHQKDLDFKTEWWSEIDNESVFPWIKSPVFPWIKNHHSRTTSFRDFIKQKFNITDYNIPIEELAELLRLDPFRAQVYASKFKK